MDLPNFHENEQQLTDEQKKRKMKERGVMPARPWTERPIILSAVFFFIYESNFLIFLNLFYFNFTDK